MAVAASAAAAMPSAATAASNGDANASTTMSGANTRPMLAITASILARVISPRVTAEAWREQHDRADQQHQPGAEHRRERNAVAHDRARRPPENAVERGRVCCDQIGVQECDPRDRAIGQDCRDLNADDESRPDH